MPESPDRSSTALPIALAAAVVGGLLFIDPSLDSPRPSPPPVLVPSEVSEEQDVNARLWADPLEIALEHEKTDEMSGDLSGVLKPYTHSLQNLAEVIHDRRLRSEGLTLIGVMVPGGPWAEDAEIRRRTRQALVLGMLRREFTPRTATKIGFARIRWDSSGRLAKDLGSTAIVPFEEFEGPFSDTVKRRGRAIVFWLSEELFQRSPVEQIQELFGNLLGFCPVESASCPVTGLQEPSIVMIGPASSTTLATMLARRDRVPYEPVEAGPRPPPPASTLNCDSGGAMPEAVRLATRLSGSVGGYVSAELERSDLEGLCEEVAQTLTAYLSDRVSGGGVRKQVRDRRIHDTLDAVWEILRRRTLEIGDYDLAWHQNVFATWARSAVSDLRGRLDPRSVHTSVRFLSPRSTVAEPFLLAFAPVSPGEVPPRDIPTALPSRVDFVSVILGDDAVAGALVEEIGRRGVDVGCGSGGAPCEKHPRIVLISESDTIYGRTLPETVASEIACSRRDTSAEKSCLAWCAQSTENGERCAAPEGVEFYGYLRGLDGKGPRHAPTSPPTAATGKKAAAPSPAPAEDHRPDGAVERAVGAQQLDHLRRLTAHLRSGKERIHAIGVLGSDFYDKQAVLQALRPHFRDAVFFTTDLDARFLHPDAYEWSRNLVIASSYDLRLGDRLQGAVPPFRGVYQTATFVAAMLSLGPIGCDGDRCLLSRDTLAEDLSPLIFEVSRSGAYPMTPHAATSPLVPTRERWDFPLGTGGLIVTVLVGLFLVVVLGSGAGRWHRGLGLREREAIWTMSAVSVVAIGTLSLLIRADMGSREGEPLELLEGISIWPSLFLQLVAALVGLALVAYAVSRLRENGDQLGEAYGFDAPNGGGPVERIDDSYSIAHDRPRKSFWRLLISRDGTDGAAPGADRTVAGKPGPILKFARRLREAAREVRIGSWDVPETVRGPNTSKHEGPMAHRIWDDYVYRGDFANRLARVLPVTLGFLAFAWGLYLALNPSRSLDFEPLIPVRGGFGQAAEPTLLFVSFLSMYFITFFVNDASKLCAAWIRNMTAPIAGVSWLDDVKKRASSDWGVAPDDVRPLLDLEVIASRSEEVSRLILYPFIVFVLMLVARIQYFDNWVWPMSIWIIFGIVSLVAVASGLRVRAAAERARSLALARLARRQVDLLGSEDHGQERSDQIRLIADRIRGLDTGAFAPWSRHPVVKALLLPLTGVGTVTLLNLFGALAR